MKINLLEIFENEVSKFCNDSVLVKKFFTGIEEHYFETHRFYHNFEHVANMISQILRVQSVENEVDTLILAAFYHDVIYFPSQTDNEFQSLIFAKNHLEKLNFSKMKIEKITSLILQTKNHFENKTFSADEKLFLDSDLAILGSENSIYQEYSQKIRKEFSFLSDEIFFAKRLNFLRNVLSQETIYKTLIFQKLFERRAKLNILSEMNNFV